METDYVKHGRAVVKKGMLRTTDQYCSDISGSYLWNAEKMELRPIGNVRLKGEKQLYTIRMGYTGNNLFLNHTDYETVKTTYKQFDNMVTFFYNFTEYQFEMSDAKTVKITRKNRIV
jgi:hypothetical protein